MVDNVQMIGCGFLPIDQRNERILISKRSSGKEYYPGLWEILGGNLEYGEDFIDCVHREVLEEINCGISKLRHLHSRVMYLDNRMYITVFYYGDLVGNPQIDKSEIAELVWISEADVESYDFCPGDKEILSLAFNSVFQN